MDEKEIEKVFFWETVLTNAKDASLAMAMLLSKDEQAEIQRRLEKEILIPFLKTKQDVDTVALKALQGDPVAQRQYAEKLAKKEDRIKWYEKSANQGDAESQYRLGYLLEGEQGKQWYIQAANLNHAGACQNLGHLYYQEKKHASAKQYAQKAYALGNLSGLNILASCCYREGDRKKAIQMFRTLVDSPHPEPCWLHNYGLTCYQDGTAKEHQEARSWIQKAADQDYSSAKKWLLDNKL